MNESSLFIYAIVVFSFMSVGLILTVLEFRYGQPKKQENIAKRKLANNNLATNNSENSSD